MYRMQVDKSWIVRLVRLSGNGNRTGLPIHCFEISDKTASTLQRWILLPCFVFSIAYYTYMAYTHRDTGAHIKSSDHFSTPETLPKIPKVRPNACERRGRRAASELLHRLHTPATQERIYKALLM